MSEHISAAGHLDQQLMVWAAEYATDPGNKLAALDYNPEKYLGQKGHVVRSESTDKSFVKLIATEAFKPHSFDSLLEQLEQPLQQERLHAIGELLNGKNNVVLATNHGDLIDIAIAHAAVYHQLESLGYSPRTGIIISKMVAFLGYELLGEPSPCPQVLQALENEIFLSYPRTASAEKHGIARILPDEAKQHNRHMRRDVVKSLGGGSLLLAVAMSGTTDKSFGSADILHMAPVGEGTADTLTQEHTYVLPTSLYYRHESAHIALTDTPRFIDNTDVLHRAMASIATNLTQNVEGITYTYAAKTG